MNSKERKSVCLLINTLDSGGAEKVCVTIGNELAKKRYQVDLWVRDKKETTLSKIVDPQINISYLGSKRVRQSIIPLAKLLRSRNPEIILVFDLEFLVIIHFLKKFYNYNFKIIFRSINTLSISYSDRRGIWGKVVWFPLIKYFLGRCDVIIAQSSGMKRDMIISFNISESKIITIHNPAVNLQLNGYDHEHINNEFEFLFVGRLNAPKGLFYMIDAFNMALQKEPKLRLTLVGEGPEKAKIQTKIHELNLGKSIILEGYQSNPISYYKRAKATLLTSLYEGFPNVLVESIAVGTPVISFNCPSGPLDIIEPNINGILVEHLNVQGIADAIINVAHGKIAFEKQKVKASAIKFDLSTIIKQYEEVLFQS